MKLAISESLILLAHKISGTTPDDAINSFILDVLDIAAATDCHDSIWWRTDSQYAPITFFVRCNDFFWWATADCEPLTMENISILRQALLDVGVDNEDWGYLLFCARARKKRPQNPAYPKDEHLKKLFDACGPERTPWDQEGISEESYKKLIAKRKESTDAPWAVTEPPIQVDGEF